MQERLNRGTGLILAEAVASNINGDPDRDSDPRLRYDDRGEVSPVSFKRKIRDVVLYKGGPVWKEVAEELEIAEDEYDNFDILENKDRKLTDIKAMTDQDILKRFWDARVFGTTTLGKEKEGGSAIRTGVAQVGLGVSLSPVRIERMTTTKMAAVQEGKDKGMAPLGFRVVSYGVYAIPFFINATAAAKTNCSKRDIELLLKLIPCAYRESASYIRPQVNIRHAFYIEHNSARGCYNDFEMIEALTPKRLGDNTIPAESWNDYDIEQLMVNKEKLANDLIGKTHPIRDLVQEW